MVKKNNRGRDGFLQGIEALTQGFTFRAFGVVRKPVESARQIEWYSWTWESLSWIRGTTSEWSIGATGGGRSYEYTSLSSPVSFRFLKPLFG